MIHQGYREVVGRSDRKKLFQAQPEKQQIWPRLSPDLEQELNSAFNQRLRVLHIPSSVNHSAHDESQRDSGTAGKPCQAMDQDRFVGVGIHELKDPLSPPPPQECR
jgi:hypothetical protein